MRYRRWLGVLGALLSLALLTILLVRLDWPTFWVAIQRVSWYWLGLAGAVTACGILLRSLRWTLIAGVPLGQYRFFWRAASLGYLGNAIYPARAGEALRMVLITRSAGLPMPKAVTSALVDRVADLAMLGVVVLGVAAHHGAAVLGPKVLLGMAGLIGIPLAGVVFFALKGKGYQPLVVAVSRSLPTIIGSRLPHWYTQAYAGLGPLRSRQRIAAIVALNVVVFLLDYLAMWLVFLAFGWLLPFGAAVTVGVFIAGGTALPSAPGYVGVYQVAAMLALGLYGLSGASAVAYAVVLQSLNLAVTTLLCAIAFADGKMAALRRAQPSPSINA